MLNFLEATTGNLDMMSSVVMIGIMFAVMYFMVIRPENKRKKEADEMRAGLRVGDEIISAGGICGKIVDIKENKIVIETGADRVRIEFVKDAISTNETAAARAAEEAKKAEEAKAKAKAAKKAEKGL